MTIETINKIDKSEKTISIMLNFKFFSIFKHKDYI